MPHEARGSARAWRGAGKRATFEHVDAWREGISGAFVPLAPQALGGGAFHAAFHQIQRGAIGLSRIEGSPQSVRRGAREIAATRGDVAYLNIQLSGMGRVRSGGSVRNTHPGSGAIVLAEHLFELEFDNPFSQLCVAMPIGWLQDRLKLPLAIAATRDLDLLHGAGRVVKAALSALMEAADATEAAQCGDLFGCALDHALRPGALPATSPDTGLIHAIERLLRQRLGDDTLTPASAAIALGCSVRSLHAACHGEGRSFGRLLLDARLDAAHCALRSIPPSAGRVGQIAFACGFSSLPHFSRAFRARFGMAPSNCRG